MGWRIGLKWHRWKEPLNISCLTGAGQQYKVKVSLAWSLHWAAALQKMECVLLLQTPQSSSGVLEQEFHTGKKLCLWHTPQRRLMDWPKMCKFLSWGREKEPSRTQLQCQRALVVTVLMPTRGRWDIIRLISNKLNWLLSRCTSATTWPLMAGQEWSWFETRPLGRACCGCRVLSSILLTEPFLWGSKICRAFYRGAKTKPAKIWSVACRDQHSRLPTKDQWHSVWHRKEPGKVYLQPVDYVLDWGPRRGVSHVHVESALQGHEHISQQDSPGSSQQGIAKAFRRTLCRFIPTYHVCVLPVKPKNRTQEVLADLWAHTVPGEEQLPQGSVW